MTQGQSPQTLLAPHRHRPRHRVWIPLLVAYWIVSSIAIAVLPWTLALLPALLTPPTGLFGMNETTFLAGSMVLGWIMFVPIATAVGLALGLASAACVRITKLWEPDRRRGRWVRYVGTLILAYTVVVAAVHVLAPTAAQPVTFYALCAALLAVGSCLLLALLDRPGHRPVAT